MASKSNSKTKSNSSLKVAKTVLQLLIKVAVLLIVIYAVSNVGKTLYNISYNIFGNTGVSESQGVDVYIKVEQGESTMNVARKLEQNKVIDNAYSFYIHAKLKGHSIMPGTFALNTSMDYEDIFAIITVPYTEEEPEEQGYLEPTKKEAA